MKVKSVNYTSGIESCGLLIKHGVKESDSSITQHNKGGVRALAGDAVLCSWARHFILTVPLSSQEYKRVRVICWGNLTNCWGVTCDGLASRPGGVEILLAASCYGSQDELWPDEPHGSKASLKH